MGVLCVYVYISPVWSPSPPIPRLRVAMMRQGSPPKGAMWDGARRKKRAPGMTRKKSSCHNKNYWQFACSSTINKILAYTRIIFNLMVRGSHKPVNEIRIKYNE